MLCTSCNTEISPTFKHAISQNMCPACGGSIMDEEALGLLEDIKSTISNEAKLRDETVHKLAMALFSKYNISPNGAEVNFIQQKPVVKKVQPTNVINEEEDIKIAPPSDIRKIEENVSVVKAEEVMVEGISEKERERIMEQAIREKYAIVDQIQSNSTDIFDDENSQPSGDSLFSEDVNPILEQNRLARLAKQKQAMKSGTGAFRRSG